MNRNIPILILFFSLALGGNLWGGGAMLVEDIEKSGEPSRWGYDPAGKNWVIRWKIDTGPLSNSINHEKAKGWVQALFDKWEKDTALPVKGEETPVLTTALKFIFDGVAAQDITADNYSDYINPDIERLNPGEGVLPTVIIFDVDGSITEKVYGGEDTGSGCGEPKNCIVGFGSPSQREASGKRIVSGFVVLNGRLLDGVSNDENNELDEERFKSVILHEIGHMINLDHSQVNREEAETCESFDCPQGVAITTMYPSSLSKEQYSLHRDDIVTVSWLYPTTRFLNEFCTAVGEIVDEAGNGLQGINVIARNVADPVRDARSWVSGSLFPAGTKNGHFVLPGISPGEHYEITYEELTHQYDGGGGFAPLGSASPTGFGEGPIAGLQGSKTIHCDKGGEIIDIPDFKLSLTPVPPATDPDAGAGAGGDGAAQEGIKEKKGWWCQLNPKAPFQNSTAAGSLIIFSFLLYLLILRRYKCRDAKNS